MKKDVCVVLAHCDTQEKLDALDTCITSILKFNKDIILVSHTIIPNEISSKCIKYTYDENNGVVHYEDYHKFNITFDRYVIMNDVDGNSIKLFEPFKMCHSYAVWQLMQLGCHSAKELGYQNLHYINYDTIISNSEILDHNNSLLNIKDFVFFNVSYDHGNTDEYLTCFYSANVDKCKQLLSEYNSVADFFKNKNRSPILEKVIRSSIVEKNYNHFLFKRNYLESRIPELDLIKNESISVQDQPIHFCLDGDFKCLLIRNSTHYSEYVVNLDQKEPKVFHLAPNQNKVIPIQGINEVTILKDGDQIYRGKLPSKILKKLSFISRVNHYSVNPKVINLNFISGAHVSITDSENPDKEYLVKFTNKKTNRLEYESKLKHGWWAKTNKKYYVDWKIEIESEGKYTELSTDLSGKRVLIGFESKSLGDTIAWVPYVEEFRKKHNCTVICSTFLNHMFEKFYPKIEFVPPGTVVNNLIAQYSIGVYYDNETEVDYNRHPFDFRLGSLQKIAADILGIDYVELLPTITDKVLPKKNQISIAIHSTAQAKYWNNENGWQAVVDWCIDNGYTVKLLSAEEDGYMGNKTPKRIVKHPFGPIDKVIDELLESKAFIGIGSGLSWLSLSCGVPTILISGFSEKYTEPSNAYRIGAPQNVCSGCFNKFVFDHGDWNWCPVHKGTDRQFECTKEIKSETVIEQLKLILNY